MKFLNKETNSIIVVDKKDKAKIAKFKGYPDKFELVDGEVIGDEGTEVIIPQDVFEDIIKNNEDENIEDEETEETEETDEEIEIPEAKSNKKNK